jgi:hypothetical protein
MTKVYNWFDGDPARDSAILRRLFSYNRGRIINGKLFPDLGGFRCVLGYGNVPIGGVNCWRWVFYLLEKHF